MMAGFDLHSVRIVAIRKSAQTLALRHHLLLARIVFRAKRSKVVYPCQGSRHSQSHPRGPGTCVDSGGRGWPDNLWFEWAGREEV